MAKGVDGILYSSRMCEWCYLHVPNKWLDDKGGACPAECPCKVHYGQCLDDCPCEQGRYRLRH